MDEVPTTWGTCSRYTGEVFIAHGREGGEFLWGRVVQIVVLIIATVACIVIGAIMMANTPISDGLEWDDWCTGYTIAVGGGLFIPIFGGFALGATWENNVKEVRKAQSARYAVECAINRLVSQGKLSSVEEANHWDSNFKPVVSNVLTDQQHLQLEKSGWVSTQVSELDQAKIAVKEAILAANAADKAIGLKRVGQVEKLTQDLEL